MVPIVQKPEINYTKYNVCEDRHTQETSNHNNTILFTIINVTIENF